jgi:hypothetical protein
MKGNDSQKWPKAMEIERKEVLEVKQVQEWESETDS